jgi:Rrf2 family transcriptional regulator, iron-sulfur cluster assembly transcription factor
MRLSNRAIYGLRAVVDLAYHGDGEPMQVRDIAERGQIPNRFLEQIFQELKRSDIVASKRGPGGGYLLVADPQVLTLAEVLEALDDLPEVPEVACGQELEGAARLADDVCREVVEQLVKKLEALTIGELVRRGEELGLARQGYEGFVYVI